MSLLSEIASAKKRWADDPAYADILFKLDQVAQELDVLTASPGRRAALRASFGTSGQASSTPREAPSKAQAGKK